MDTHQAPRSPAGAHMAQRFVQLLGLAVWTAARGHRCFGGRVGRASCGAAQPSSHCCLYEWFDGWIWLDMSGYGWIWLDMVGYWYHNVYILHDSCEVDGWI